MNRRAFARTLLDAVAFSRKVFGMRKDRAIIPHGHQNMVSCHYVLKGALQLKHIRQDR